MLTILDSNGSTGGVSPSLYSITGALLVLTWNLVSHLQLAGSDTSCIPPTPSGSSVAKITPNVTTTLTTCDPWGLTITGGKKPYTIVLSALDSPVITNSTMGAEDDVYTYIDRADPNAPLMGEYITAPSRADTTR